eukprot:m.114473 g.114473  ORF g.114473 m.114473 type:complete len:81 (-) comp13053_c0_seq2:6409-6651(-)
MARSPKAGVVFVGSTPAGGSRLIREFSNGLVVVAILCCTSTELPCQQDFSVCSTLESATNSSIFGVEVVPFRLPVCQFWC